MESTNQQLVPQGSNFSRRSVLRAAGLAALVPALGGLAACGGGSTGNTTPGKASLSFLYLGDANQQAAFKQLFAEFNKQNPDITLNATGIPAGDWGSFVNTVSTQIAGGKVPDIIQVATEGQALLASKGLLEPLDDYIAKDKAAVDDYYGDVNKNLLDWTKKYGSTDGKTYYMPGGFNTVALYANTSLFQKAGVELPSGDWSWDDFKKAGHAIKDKTGAYLIPAAFGFPFADIMPWLLTNGTSTLNADWTEATYNSPEAVQAAEFVKSLIDEGLSPKPGGQFDAGTQMKQGKLATFASGRFAQPGIKSINFIDGVQIIQFPKNKANGSPIGWDAWPILKASKNKDAAWTFIKFLISKQASEYFAKVGGTNVPARNAVAQSEAFTGGAPKNVTLFSKSVEWATPIPSPAKGAQMQKFITEAWQQSILGTKPVQEALDSANKQIQALL